MAGLRWLAFATYLTFCLCLPPALLWGLPGLACGALAGVFLLLGLRWHGTGGLSLHQQSVSLTRAEAPAEYAVTQELCRRLRLPMPSLRVLESQELNVAFYGFTASNTYLLFTRGMLQQLDRAQLTAVIARMLTNASTGDLINQTWLARFFDFLYSLLLPSRSKANSRNESLALARVFQQIVLYPLTLLPAAVLQSSRSKEEGDSKCLLITKDPRSLAEALRKMQYGSARTPCRVPFGARHLFLCAPASADPLTRLFFAGATLDNRLRQIENYQLVNSK